MLSRVVQPRSIHTQQQLSLPPCLIRLANVRPRSCCQDIDVALGESQHWLAVTTQTLLVTQFSRPPVVVALLLALITFQSGALFAEWHATPIGESLVYQFDLVFGVISNWFGSFTPVSTFVKGPQKMRPAFMPPANRDHQSCEHFFKHLDGWTQNFTQTIFPRGSEQRPRHSTDFLYRQHDIDICSFEWNDSAIL